MLQPFTPIIRRLLNFFLCILLCTTTLRSLASPIFILTVDGAIGPASAQYIQDGIEAAEKSKASLIVLRLDTLGGLVSSTLEITQSILNTRIPFATFVAPKGASATSAGAFIVYASPIAAMAPATNIGASSPIPLGGDTPYTPPQDSGDKSTQGERKQTTGQIKALEDLSARMQAMAQQHGRNAEAAVAMVREGKSFSAQQALADNIINLSAEDTQDLLKKLDGYILKQGDNSVTLRTQDATIVTVEHDWMDDLLNILTNPNITYFLILIGVYGIILEFYSPGSFYPGVIGSISLLLAAYGLHLLPLNYAGLALMLLGLAFLLIELTTPSYGIFGLGGTIAFVLGSVFLFDTASPLFQVSLWLVGLMTVLSLAFVYIVFYFVIGALRAKASSGCEAMLGERAVAVSDFQTTGEVRYQGIIYKAQTSTPITQGQTVYITHVNGIVLTVSTTKP